MSMDNSSDSQEDVHARHRTYVNVLEGHLPMDWSAWALPIYDAKALTPLGRKAALWAVDVFRDELGDRFITEAWTHQQAQPPVEIWEDPNLHPVFSQAFWPGANSAPWVFTNLLELATRIRLCARLDRYPRTRKSMRDYRDVTKWIHGLLQFEVASLGLRAGYQVSFEPSLETGHHADVYLIAPHAAGPILVETSSMRVSDAESKALHLARELSDGLLFAIFALKERHALDTSGTIHNLLTRTQADEWLRNIEAAAEAVTVDGVAREVTGPTAGVLRIAQAASGVLGTVYPGLSVEGPRVFSDPFARLQAKISEKAEQASGHSQPVWVRIEEFAGLWPALTQNGLELSNKLDLVARHVQNMLEPHTQLAGVILAPTDLWAGNLSEETLNVRLDIPDRSACAVRSALPLHRAHETIIVARRGLSDASLATIAQLYTDESTWLNWALTHLGQPTLGEIFQES